MRISIVTISYNQRQFLGPCIESVLGQDYDDVEHIVVDAGSTDGSRGIIEEYGDRLVKLFEADEGPADGLNKGFALATGDVLGFLNSDDMLLPGALRRVVEQLTLWRSVDVLSGHAWIVDSYGRRLRRIYSDAFDLRAFAYGAAVLVQPSTFFRRDIFVRAGGFEGERSTGWDGALWMQMALNGARFALIDDFLSCYRLHPNSITYSRRLGEESIAERKARFEIVMGREEQGIDTCVRWVYLMRKYLLEPRSLLQRIAHGRAVAPRGLRGKGNYEGD